MSNWSKIRR